MMTQHPNAFKFWQRVQGALGSLCHLLGWQVETVVQAGRPDQHVLTVLPGVSIQWAGDFPAQLAGPSLLPAVDEEEQHQQSAWFKRCLAACVYEGSRGAWRQWWAGLTPEQQRAHLVGVANSPAQQQSMPTLD